MAQEEKVSADPLAHQMFLKVRQAKEVVGYWWLAGWLSGWSGGLSGGWVTGRTPAVFFKVCWLIFYTGRCSEHGCCV